MAVPLRNNQGTEPGKTRRARENDFAYLNEAANDADYAPIDKQYSASAYQENVLRPVGLGRKEAANDEDNGLNGPIEPIYFDEDRDPTPPNRSRRALSVAQKAARGAGSLAADTTARVRASAINSAAWSWGVPLWLFVQLPLALLCLTGLGVGVAVDELTRPSTGGFWNWLTQKAASITVEVAKSFGVDFASISMNLAVSLSLLIMAIGLFTILFLWLQYVLGGLRPLSGKAAGLKWGLLLLAFIGYSLPGANIFPFVLLWMGAVWLFPR